MEQPRRRVRRATLAPTTAREDFAEKLASVLFIPLEMVDERFSTVTARDYMRETGKKKDRFKKHDDAIAAAVILQSYLDEASARRG